MTVSETNFDLNYRKIAKNIKALRKLHHMTQAQLAEKLDMDTQYYSVIERADTPNRNFTLDKVLRACYIFNVTPNDIMGTDFVSENRNRDLLISRLCSYLEKMSEHELNVMLKYAEDIIPMM